MKSLDDLLFFLLVIPTIVLVATVILWDSIIEGYWILREAIDE